jgi:hypothetical protein
MLKNERTKYKRYTESERIENFHLINLNHQAKRMKDPGRRTQAVLRFLYSF